MPKAPSSTKQTAITSVVALFAIALLVVGVVATKPKAGQSSASSPASASADTGGNSSSDAGKTYKDGSYQATGSYSSPGGTQKLAVNLTLANNTITDAMVTPSAKDGVAQVYQSYFVNNYKQKVVGKSINGLHLSQVAGSSLTSKGFNDALERIKQQAQS